MSSKGRTIEKIISEGVILDNFDFFLIISKETKHSDNTNKSQGKTSSSNE